MTKIQPRNSCYSCLPETSPRKLPIATARFKWSTRTDKAFQIDALGLRDEVLRKCASAAKTAETHVAVANGAADAAEMAVAKDNFPAAITLIDLAIAESRKAKDDSTVKRLSERRAEIDAIAQAFSAVKKALATLESSPTDPDANLLVGKYDCFAKCDWAHGLPMLALGNEPTLKSLGEQEVKGVASSEEQAHLGDAWWNCGRSRQRSGEKVDGERAAYWYQSALPRFRGCRRIRWQAGCASSKTICQSTCRSPCDRNSRNGPEQYVDFRTVFKGKASPHTHLGTPADGKLVFASAYQLDGRFRVLRGDAGISSGEICPPASPLTFRIVGDGKTLWKSKPLQTARLFRTIPCQCRQGQET